MNKAQKVYENIYLNSESNEEFNEILSAIKEDYGYTYKNNHWYNDNSKIISNNDLINDTDGVIDNMNNSMDEVQRERYANGEDESYMPQDDDDVEWLNDLD